LLALLNHRMDKVELRGKVGYPLKAGQLGVGQVR